MSWPGAGADPDHVRERGRVARKRPRRHRRLVAVPDGRDEHGALLVGVGDRVRLEPRERIARGRARIADAAEAEVDHPRALVRGPADRGRLGAQRDRSVGADDLRDHELRRWVGDPDDALPVERGSDLAGDEGAVALLVGAPVAADEAPAGGDPTGELRMTGVDARVDDRDLRRREERRRRRLVPRVEGVVLREVPLLRRQRVGRGEGGRGRRRCQGGDGGPRQEPRPVHPETTRSGGVVPAAKPLEAATRAR